MELMEFVQVNSRKLSGPALDWAAARVLDHEVEVLPPLYGTGPRVFVRKGSTIRKLTPYRPTKNWNDAGELISRFMFEFSVTADGAVEASAARMHAVGNDHQEALCRAVVSSFAGEHVMVPIQLFEPEQIGEVA